MNSSSRAKLLLAASRRPVCRVGLLSRFRRAAPAESDQSTEKFGRSPSAGAGGEGPGVAGKQRQQPPLPGMRQGAATQRRVSLLLAEEKGESGKSDANKPSVSLVRGLAWTLVGFTTLLGAVHVGRLLWGRRRLLSAENEVQLQKRGVLTASGECDSRPICPARYGSCPTCKQSLQFKPRCRRILRSANKIRRCSERMRPSLPSLRQRLCFCQIGRHALRICPPCRLTGPRTRDRPGATRPSSYKTAAPSGQARRRRRVQDVRHIVRRALRFAPWTGLHRGSCATFSAASGCQKASGPTCARSRTWFFASKSG